MVPFQGIHETDAYYDVMYVRKYANAEPYANDTSGEIEWT